MEQRSLDGVGGAVIRLALVPSYFLLAEHPMKTIKSSRAVALRVLSRVETDRAYANLLLDAELQHAAFADPRDAALTTELVYGVLRWQSTLDWYLNQVCKQPLETTDPLLRRILRLGAYQLLMLDKIPASAAINEAVNLVAGSGNALKIPAKTAKGFVNALLRQLDRQRQALTAPATLADPQTRLATQYAFPAWLIARWIQRAGVEFAEQLCQAHNQPAPLTLRVNSLRGTLAEFQQRLAGSVASVTPLPAGLPGVVVIGSHATAALPGFQEGSFLPQNASSMLIARILNPQPGEQILDVCAGSGIKTTQIGEMMRNSGTITAADLHADKLQRLQENCRRLGVTNVRTICADMTQVQEFPGAPHPQFDRIVIDAPCSGLGVLRKHPEAKWQRRAADIAPLQQLQIRLLTHTAQFLTRDHGVIVYSACTTEPEENEAVIAEFLRAAPEFMVQSCRDEMPAELQAFVTADGFLKIEPPQPYFDGFFGARLIRRPSNSSVVRRI